ncbi:MAG TPA: Cof-type HAD-IIB family hydrolase [Ktedonobacteraceae bacterium]|nr:Cof-type HAD-IIB family hydrolase [Ktedonobacteraceae bacterium]
MATLESDNVDRALRDNQPPEHVKLIAIDIDGTLLDPDGEITQRTRAAIQAAQEAGIVVTLATARRYCNTAKFAAELGLEGAVIVYDGALIVTYPQNTIVATRTLQADIAQQVADLLARHRVQPVVHPYLGLVEEVWTGPPDLDNYWLDAYFLAFSDQTHRMPIASLCVGYPDPLRVVAFDSEEKIESLVPEVAALLVNWTMIKRGNYGSDELAVMHPECSKASGVAIVAETLGITMPEVMALGDNNNDLAMLRLAGWGVAMGQASAPIKAAADAVTASNMEDGAAQAIERYALRRGLSASSNSRKRAI